MSDKEEKKVEMAWPSPLQRQTTCSVEEAASILQADRPYPQHFAMWLKKSFPKMPQNLIDLMEKIIQTPPGVEFTFPHTKNTDWLEQEHIDSLIDLFMEFNH